MTETIGDRVVALRRDKNWTQQQLAVAAGLHVATVQKIERGRQEQSPANASAIKLAHALGVSLDELLTGSEPVTPAPSP